MVRLLVALVSLAAIGAAACVTIATVQWHPARTPLLLARGAARTSRPAVAPTEVMGFVSPDLGDSLDGQNRDGDAVSEFAATGIMLGPVPGTLVGTAPVDTLIRAHASSARGYLVVSNFDSALDDFNGPAADTAIGSTRTRGALASAIALAVTTGGWDGVAMDLESLPASSRSGYVELVRELRRRLPGTQLVVAVPAFGRDDTAAGAGFDVAGLAALADRIVWMAYDQHSQTGDPGPIGALSWTRVSLTTVLTMVPASKLLLGVAGYGYVWPAHGGPVRELTYADVRALQRAKGVSSGWDPASGEVHLTLPDGGQVWFQDARSFQVRLALASAAHLAGLALWRVGSEDPAALGTVPNVAHHPGLSLFGRQVERVGTGGLVALTFDDGPDPTWTPQILDVLEREHVPATFFVVGRQAEQSPDLLQRAVADGDVIGNHTYSHPDMNQIPDWQARLEIAANQAVIQGIVGRKPLLYRSPYGDGDRGTATEASRDALATSMGLQPLDWTDDPADWSRPGAGAIVDRAITQAGSATIILLHDGGGDRAQTLAALPVIIDRLRAQGATFVTADALDGAVTSPYGSRDSGLSQVRGFVLVSAIRLLWGLDKTIGWVAVTVAALSVARLAVAFPLAFAYARRRPTGAGRTPVEPCSVTVVIPAHNEAAVIGKTLAALAALPLAERAAEVIVVDDGSDDETASEVGRYPVTLIRQPKTGKAGALNVAIQAARTDLVIVLDADTIVSTDLIRCMARRFADSRVGAVAGNVKVGNRRSVLTRLQAAEYVTSLNLDRRAQAQVNVVAVVPGAAGAFRRAAVLDVGGYPDATLVEDADLTVRLLRAGWRIDYEPRALAWTEAPQTIRDALKQRRRWAFGTIQVLATHADAMTSREGLVGKIGLPWMLISQVLLPAAAPLADLTLVQRLVSGDAGPATFTLALAAAADIAVVAVVTAWDREHWSLVLVAPALRWVWRPIQVIAVLSSLRRWLRGDHHTWDASRRYATVQVPTRTSSR